jgi:hypothetical protein
MGLMAVEMLVVQLVDHIVEMELLEHENDILEVE